jgi:hypothetical protein
VILDSLVSLLGPGHHPISQSKPLAPANRRLPTESGHKLLLAEGQRGFLADAGLRRQREPA